jgi:hypothetical protein
MSKRAERRHHRERLLKLRKRNWSGMYRDDPVVLSKLVDTPTPCSCWMCRNDRQNEGPTMQEVRFFASHPLK